MPLPLAVKGRAQARFLAAVLFLAGWLAGGCTRPASTLPASLPAQVAPATPTAVARSTPTAINPVPPTQNAPGADVVSVRQVQVIQGTAITVTGEARLPAGECVRTELLAGTQPVDWWPGDACIEADAGTWEIVVPLGRRGAPERLDEAIEYKVHAWASSDPQGTGVSFPFDLSGPPQ